MPYKKEERVGRISMGKDPGQWVGVYALTKDVLGIPTVGVAGDIEGLNRILSAQAEELGNALLLAAKVARGEVPRPQAAE